MRVLVTAYAYRYGVGSEAGVGWNWVYAMASRGYEVTVFTRFEHANIARTDLINIPTHISEKIKVLAVGKRGLERLALSNRLFTYPYQYVWQFYAYKAAAALVKETHYDVLHSLTYGGVRIPSFLGLLERPSILGPIGGAEMAPLALVAPMGLVATVKETMRWISNVLTYFSPINLLKLRKFTRILFRTPESFKFFGSRYPEKSFVLADIGTPDQRAVKRSNKFSDKAALNCIFAGRFLYWKGGEIALRGFAHFLKSGGKGRLTMIGEGPSARKWKRIANQLNIAEYVDWPGWLEHNEFLKSLASCDAFVFPSLHDSGGTVVYEALCAGAPVVCLNLGGPGYLLSKIGLETIPARGYSFAQVSKLVGEALLELHRRPAAERLDVEAVNAYYESNKWSDLVQKAYRDFDPELSTDVQLTEIA